MFLVVVGRIFRVVADRVVAFYSSSGGGDEVVGRGGWDDAPSTLVLKDDVQGVDDAGNVWGRGLSAPEVWYEG
jgi:hypothetical protein